MKKIIFIITALFSFLSVLSAQISKEEAENIVLEYMIDETQLHSLFGNEILQKTISITTANGEEIELNYPCWVYYASYYDKEDDYNNSRYLIINERNGNLLEINTKCDYEPNDLVTWRILTAGKAIEPAIIAQGELYGDGNEGITKQNIVITTEEECEKLKKAINSVNNVTNNFFESDIDFDSYQVIAVFDEVRGNGGCKVQIIDIVEYNNSIVVDYNTISTPNGPAVMTQPFHIVKIPVSNKKIVFEEQSQFSTWQYVDKDVTITLTMDHLQNKLYESVNPPELWDRMYWFHDGWESNYVLHGDTIHTSCGNPNEIPVCGASSLNFLRTKISPNKMQLKFILFGHSIRVSYYLFTRKKN